SQIARARLNLVKKAHVFNCNHGLIGESLQQRDLALRERSRISARNGDCADWIAFLKQWYRRDTSINHRFGEALASRTIGRISPHIGYLYNRPTHDRPAGSRVFAGWHRKYALKSSQSFRAQTPAAGKLHYLAIKSNHERKLTIT